MSHEKVYWTRKLVMTSVFYIRHDVSYNEAFLNYCQHFCNRVPRYSRQCGEAITCTKNAKESSSFLIKGLVRLNGFVEHRSAAHNQLFDPQIVVAWILCDSTRHLSLSPVKLAFSRFLKQDLLTAAKVLKSLLLLSASYLIKYAIIQGQLAS